MGKEIIHTNDSDLLELIPDRQEQTFWLVEDDQVDAMVIKKALNSIYPGKKLHWEQDSPEAWQKLENLAAAELPDLIFLDLRMPRMDGFEFLERIKKNPATRSIRIIVVSTSSEESDISLARSLGASQYIIKTFDFPEFVDQLRGIEGIS